MNRDWVKNAIWWHIYPLGFLGADTTGADRSRPATLADLGPWLDYAVELGASGVALGPIFASSSHGYDTTDYFSIDDRIGDDESFQVLVRQCRRRGLRLMLDGVFNHVGPAFVAGPEWFVPADSGEGRPGDAGAAPLRATFEGHAGLFTLNHSEPAVVDFVVRVMTHWLDAGADGWRLDAAYAVPSSFWAEVVPRVRAAHPDAYLVGEVIHGDYAATVRDTGFDAVTQYELWKAIWSSLNDGNFHELAWALKRHEEMVRAFVPMTFVGNHDVTRLASRLTDQRHLGHAVALLLTVPGTPSVYYGDEQAFRGVKEDRAGGDDAVRPAFPVGAASAGPGELAAYGWPVYRMHQQLIGFRRRHPWLHRAVVNPVRLANTFLAYECRPREGGDGRVLVALNLSDRPESLEVPPGFGPGLGEQPSPEPAVICGPDTEPAAWAEGRLHVPAHQWAVIG